MDDEPSLPEPERPRFLLPDGCKDLIDVLRLEPQGGESESLEPFSFDDQSSFDLQVAEYLQGVDDMMKKMISRFEATASGQSFKTVILPDPVTVRDLASVLCISPVFIFLMLRKIKFCDSLDAELDFNTASTFCTHVGFAAVKPA